MEKPLRTSTEHIDRLASDFDAERQLDFGREVLGRLPQREHLQATVPKAGLFYVPYRQNAFFFGRADVLHQLHTTFDVRREAVRRQAPCCLLHALGGMGKTQIALEYAFRSRDQYDCVWWLPCQPANELMRRYALMADDLQLTGYESAGRGRKREMVKEWLECTGM